MKARELLEHWGITRGELDYVLNLHAHELAEKIRDKGSEHPEAGNRMVHWRDAGDFIDPMVPDEPL